MRRESTDPEFDGDFDNDSEYAIGHEIRMRRWSELERRSRRERRSPRHPGSAGGARGRRPGGFKS